MKKICSTVGGFLTPGKPSSFDVVFTSLLNCSFPWVVWFVVSWFSFVVWWACLVGWLVGVGGLVVFFFRSSRLFSCRLLCCGLHPSFGSFCLPFSQKRGSFFIDTISLEKNVVYVVVRDLYDLIDLF